MFRRRKPKYSFITMGVDALMITAAYCLAYWIRFSDRVIPVRDLHPFSEYAKTILFIVPTMIFVFRNYRLYSVRSPLSRIDEFFTVIKATSVVFFILMAMTFIYRQFVYSRLMLTTAWLLSIVGILIGRRGVRSAEYRERAQEGGETRLLILGMNRNTRKLIRWLRENPRLGYRMTGVLSTQKQLPPLEGRAYASVSGHSEGVEGGGGVALLDARRHVERLPILGTLDDFDRAIEAYQVQEVILADPGLPREETTELMLKCESRMIGFRLVADFYGLVTTCVDIEYVGDIPLLGLKELPLDDAWNRMVKRAFDLVWSAVGLVLLLPLMIPAALMIKLWEGGPIFYAQERVGQDGKVFRLWKFRTMRTDAESETGPIWAKENDLRVTSIGRMLRRTNLDELPQLWNVLRGDMSLVGPRPERPHFVHRFKEMIPRYMARHKIKSGLTGWAQVNGLRGNTSLKERIKYDLYYMENWSLFLDLKILLTTLRAFRNAY